MKSQNVQISLGLFNLLLEFFDYLDTVSSDFIATSDFYDIRSALHKKHDTLLLRDSYAKIVYAENEDKRYDARMSYLELKRSVHRFYD